ncbi:hypothetical protein LCD52_16645 [Rossellomorea vietnamensis]|uniref:tetratricopeptide repeat protein n=1 Tax=Rossellomorea vietnamensis TaxID=218284 RepID=UPI001CCC6C9A|nr:hypothetical protein [Rossellomorea vietnamensis]MCA0150416.1 hypothetical protein [Rossellomorea vietnamensis]
MELRPKYSLSSFNKGRLSAAREFTDREEPTKAFMHALEQKEKNRYKVLAYYGIGGIGKSRLLRELYSKIEALPSSNVIALIDFNEEKHRTPGEALIWLREEIRKKHSIKFTTFDLAYTMYWKKLNPQVSMKSNQAALPFLEEGGFIGEVIDQLENVPLAQWLPKTLKFMNGLSKYKEMLQWWFGRGKEVMAQLQEMLPNQIEEMLSVYWAADVKDYIELLPSSSSVVIFMDTYEALWEKQRQQGSYYERDAWVQEWVLQLPEVLWVIGGREKIQWAKSNSAWGNEAYLEQHLMGELSDNDCRKFLSSCGIEGNGVQNIIMEGSHGLPYYLDLMVDTYNLVKERREPQPEDFSKAPQQILDRFLRYLELSEKETLKILSFARFWTIDLFQSLVKEYKTGYPITAYQELFRFSFIVQEPGEKWNMHAIMRTSLQEDVYSGDEELYRQVHEYLFVYYNHRSQHKEIGGSEQSLAFQEAFYHGKRSLHVESFLKWFLEEAKHLKGAGQLQHISSTYDEMRLYFSGKSEQALEASILQFYGEVFLLQGMYEKSEQVYKEALSMYKRNQQDNQGYSIQICKCRMDIAEIMIHTNNYECAYTYLSDANKHLENTVEEKNEEYFSVKALSYIRLGKLDIRFSNYEDSMDHYQSAITICKEAIESKNANPVIHGLIALAYEKLGELYGSSQYEQQGDCYLKSIENYEKALENPDHPEYVRTLANMGLAYKRLGEHYSAKTHPSDKIRSFQKALAIYDKVLEQSPSFIDALEKKGHASVDYMVLQIELDLLDEALISFREAMDAFQQVIDLAPLQGGSRNRMASAHRELSKLYLKKNQREKALETLHASLTISNTVLQETPNYIYIFNGIGKAHELIADIYHEAKENEKALHHYQRAVEYYDKMLSKAPKLRGALKRKERIEEILGGK